MRHFASSHVSALTPEVIPPMGGTSGDRGSGFKGSRGGV